MPPTTIATHGDGRKPENASVPYARMERYCRWMMIAGIAMVVGGISLMTLGAVARAGRLTRQSVVGLRTKATLASDEAWEAGNEAAAFWVIGAGAVLAVGGVLVMLTDSQPTGEVVALVATALMLLPLTVAFRRGQAAARSI